MLTKLKMQINNLTSVFHASVLLLIMNFVTTHEKLTSICFFFTITNCQIVPAKFPLPLVDQ